jgi:hypothetical protein
MTDVSAVTVADVLDAIVKVEITVNDPVNDTGPELGTFDGIVNISSATDEVSVGENTLKIVSIMTMQIV